MSMGRWPPELAGHQMNKYLILAQQNKCNLLNSDEDEEDS